MKCIEMNDFFGLLLSLLSSVTVEAFLLIYFTWNVCPTTCMQHCYHNIFNMVVEEESSESHDALDLTSSNPFPQECVMQKYVRYSALHISRTSLAWIECVTLPHATLCSIQ